MNIVWNPNPLATVVSLDEHDKALLWHRVKIAHLEEAIMGAHFDLDPEHQQWCRTSLKDRGSMIDFVADARRHIDYPYLCGDEEREGETFNKYVSKMTDELVSELASHHCGDCTCVASSCLKCHAEKLVGVNTIAGLGRHEASAIRGAFGSKGQPPVDERALDEAIASLDNYEPKDACGLPHVDRWRQDARRAHDWLWAYREAHFARTAG